MPYNEKLTNRIRDTLARTHNSRLAQVGLKQLRNQKVSQIFVIWQTITH